MKKKNTDIVDAVQEEGVFDKFVDTYRKMCGKLCGQDCPKVSENPMKRLIKYTQFVVDNFTGGGGGGISEVEHDATLDGKGTSADPLKVTNPGITAVVKSGLITGNGKSGSPVTLSNSVQELTLNFTLDDGTIVTHTVLEKV